MGSLLSPQTFMQQKSSPWHCPYFFKQTLILCRMWLKDVEQPLEWQQQCPDTCLCQSTRGERHALPSSTTQCREGSVDRRQGEVRGLCNNTACSLCCSFSLKMLFDHGSKIIHLCHLPPFRAAVRLLGCSAKPEAAQHSEVWTAPVNTELTLTPTSVAIQTA